MDARAGLIQRERPKQRVNQGEQDGGKWGADRDSDQKSAPKVPCFTSELACTVRVETTCYGLFSAAIAGELDRRDDGITRENA